MQYKDLDVRYRFDESKAKKVYPLVRGFQLIRVKTADDMEWLKSRQEWIGLDSLANEVEITFTDPEAWDRPDFKRS